MRKDTRWSKGIKSPGNIREFIAAENQTPKSLKP